MKNLGNWNTDLKARYEFFELWAQKGQPFVFHISYFTYPTGFTTSLLQRFSRKAGSPPIDKLEFDFIPTQKSGGWSPVLRSIFNMNESLPIPPYLLG